MATDSPAGAFVCGRGAREKALGELKSEFALDVVPTHHYGANHTWQQLSSLAYNITRNLQLDTLATPWPHTRKRTFAYRAGGFGVVSPGMRKWRDLDGIFFSGLAPTR